MFDCSKDVVAHHDAEVTLPDGERTEMRDRRNANRKRLESGLERDEKPSVLEFKSQGSYAMRTMTQHPNKDYDIDDGSYFDKEDLVNPDGSYMSAFEARTMVRDAVASKTLFTPPEVCDNCVRVHYQAGYHVDIPVYRRVVEIDAAGVETVFYELASKDKWVRSDARDVTAWFREQNHSQSPDETNGRQLRRVTRNLKDFARSRDWWETQNLSGFGITKLVTERYVPDIDREDSSLYDTMISIRDRLNIDLVIKHPCTEGATITKDAADPKAIFFRDRLNEAIADLAVLFQDNCTRDDALNAWDKVFNTTFFSDRSDIKKGVDSSAATSVLTAGLIRDTAAAAMAREPVRKEGDRRYA